MLGSPLQSESTHSGCTSAGEVISDYTLGTYMRVDRLSTIMQKMINHMSNDGLKKKLVVGTNTHACKKITKKETDKNLKLIRETVLINY